MAKEDEGLRDTFSNIRHYCRENCTRPRCIDDHSVTHLHPFLETQVLIPTRVMISALSQQFPKTTVIVYPTVGFTEFITFVCSSFNLWFGVSILYLNPTKVRWRRLLQRGRKVIQRSSCCSSR
jgi:hypothetical protein